MDYSLLPPLPEGAKHVSIIPEYEHLFGYAALPDGTILTCKPKVPTKGITYIDHWRKKHTYKTKVGYVIIKTKTKKGGKCVTDKLHRVIAGLFIDNPNNYPIINHKNGVKYDNRVDNLEWCTHKQNSIHSIENGFRNTAKGEKIPNSILTEADIFKIFEMKINGKTNKEIAAIYNIDVSGVSRILNRQSWAHVNIPETIFKDAHRVYSKMKNKQLSF